MYYFLSTGKSLSKCFGGISNVCISLSLCVCVCVSVSVVDPPFVLYMGEDKYESELSTLHQD